MPLLDHFHPPLQGHRHWEGFHGRWAAAMTDGLNENLPPEYFAEFQVTLGTRIEVDVATFTEDGAPEAPRPDGAATAVQTCVWAPPAPVAVLPAVFPDDFAVHVFSSMAGPTLVAAIELVSPGNKDRDEARRAFAAKCAAYLQRGIGLIVVDIVTLAPCQPARRVDGVAGARRWVPVPRADATLRHSVPAGAPAGTKRDRPVAGAAGAGTGVAEAAAGGARSRLFAD